jgi:hypothetical protein
MITVNVSNILLNNNPCPAGTKLALYDGVYKSNYTIVEDNTVGAIATIVNSNATLYFNLPLPCQYTLAGPGIYNNGEFPTFYINTYPRNTLSTLVKNDGFLDPIYPPVSGKLVNNVTQAKVYPLYDFVEQTWNMGTITPTIRTNSSPTGYNVGAGTYVIGIPSYYPNPPNWGSLSDKFQITTNQNVSVTTQNVAPVGPVGPVENVFRVVDVLVLPEETFRNIGTIGDIITLKYTDKTVTFNSGNAVAFSNGNVSATGTVYDYVAPGVISVDPYVRITITAISGPSYSAESGTTTVGGFSVSEWSGEDNATFYVETGTFVFPPPQIGDTITFTIPTLPSNIVDIQYLEDQTTIITKGSSSADATITTITQDNYEYIFVVTLNSVPGELTIAQGDIFSMQFPLKPIPAGPRFTANFEDIIILPYPPLTTTTTTTTAAPTYTVTNYIVCPLFITNSATEPYKGSWSWGSIGPSGTSNIQLDLKNRLVTGTNPPPDVTDTYPSGSRMFYIHKPYFEYAYYSKIDVSGVKIANLDVSEINFGGDYIRTIKIVDRNGNDLGIPNYNNPDPNNQITNYMRTDSNGIRLYNFVESTYTVSYTGTYYEYSQGTYSPPYSGTYEIEHTGTYSSSYTGTYEEIYYGNVYSGSYTGTYAIPYPSPTPGTYKTVEYTGTYQVDIGGTDPLQDISIKPNNNNYGSLTVPFLFRQDGTHNVVIEYSKG